MVLYRRDKLYPHFLAARSYLEKAMTLPHGRAILAKDLELEVGREFTVEKFASLCNAIAWYLGRQTGSAQLSFTERVNVADNGIDAEWTIEVPTEGVSKPTIIGAGWNVFQYKKRDVTAQGRKKTITDLVSNVKGALKHIENKEHRHPNRYALFTNVDLIKSDKNRLRKSIRTNCRNSDRVKILIYGAAEIAGFANGLPHLRSAYFSTNSFVTWRSGWDFHSRQKLVGSNIELTGRNGILEDLKTAVDDPTIQVIVVSGPHQIGKSRIMLEATKNHQMETVVALDPLAVGGSDLLALRSDSGEVLIIVEDLDLDSAKQLANTALGVDGIKLLLTAHTGDHVLAVNFGLDPRLRHLPLGPLSEGDSYTLLRLAGAKFDYGVESWVVQQSGGNPGILLAAAQTTDMRSKADDFTDQIARSLEGRIRDSFGEKGLKAVRAISLMTRVGFRDQSASEIKQTSVFVGTDVAEVLDSVPNLEAAGIVRARGSFLDVTPPLLANYEATRAIKGKAALLSELLPSFTLEGQERLIKRLRTLHGGEIETFWREFLNKDGQFSDIKSALGQLPLLLLIVVAVPEPVATLLFEGLSQMSYEDRLRIKGRVRRNLMWILEELLYRKKTSEKALRSIALLAEAENESVANNASGVFCESFPPLHPQLPLRVDVRLNVLRDALDASRSGAMNVLAVKAIAQAFNRHAVGLLHRSDGPLPLDSRPETTWSEVWAYYSEAANLVIAATKSKPDEVSKEARLALPRVVTELIIQTPPLESTKRCVEVVTRILNGEIEVSMNDLGVQLTLAKENVDSYPDEHPRKNEARESSKLLETLIKQVDEGSFDIRVKRWIGGFHSGKLETDQAGNRIFESDRKIEALCHEAVAGKCALTPKLLDWLISDDAKQNWAFFYRLGQADEKRQFIRPLEDLVREDRGARPFGAYIAGLSTHSLEVAEDRLDLLVKDSRIVGRAFIYASLNQPGHQRSVKRLQLLIRQKRIEPDEVSRVLSTGGWSKNLTTDLCFKLMSSIAGESLQNAGAVIEFLNMWIHGNKPIEGNLAVLAWRCLEAMPGDVDIYSADVVAAALVHNDVERAFRLFALLMKQPYNRKGWEPIDHRGTRQFWYALHAADKTKLLKLVFSFDFEKPTRALNISWHLPGLINWEEDKEILREIALGDERRAEHVLSCSPQVGVWPLAIELLQRFPDSSRLRSMVISRAEHAFEGIVGSRAAHYEKCAAEIQKVLDSSSLPARLRTFLTETHTSLRDAATRQKRTEEDEYID
jgi:hypothetical protein